MTYEEKLDKIIQKLASEREMSRKGRTSKVPFYENSFTKINLEDVGKILLQLQDDEQILKIIDVYKDAAQADPFEQPQDENFADAVAIFIETTDTFDAWYSHYLHNKHSQIQYLDWINLLKILDVCNDISEKLQVSTGPSVLIPSFPYPYLGRFVELFPVDTVGTRKAYQQHRWEGANYLKQQRVALTVEAHGDDIANYGSILVKVDETKFAKFYQNIKSIFEQRRLEQLSQKDNQPTTSKPTNESPSNSTNTPLWSEDFTQDDKTFKFGTLGKIPFTSKDRAHIMQQLFDKQGNWTPISALKGNKDNDYVRTTITQIEQRLPADVKPHIQIVSTLEDDLPGKPKEGAYRIRFTPKT